MKNLIHLFIGIVASLFFTCTAMAYQPFPDTGQTMCYDAGNNAVSCDTIQPGDPLYGQDAHYQPRLPRSYTKLGQGGVVLSDEALHIDDGGPWIMTRDNVTGLVWEIKTNANKDHLYTWSDAQSQFIAGLNSAGFGGFSNWRLPDVKELSSLVNSAEELNIDTFWFPKNVSSSSYWSSTTYVSYTDYAWYVLFNSGYHHCGTLLYGSKSSSSYVRAVRSGPPPQSSLVDNLDGTVTDSATGLMWQKCSYGQVWDNNQQICTASPWTRTWLQALEEVENLSWANYDDWRLPNRNELQSLVDYSLSKPAIDPVFASVSSGYWSSTTYLWTNRTFCVDFDRGSVNVFKGKTTNNYFRAVRGGQDLTKGTIRIDIEPDGAVVAGAQWRIQGTTIWRNSGTMIIAPIGNHTIEFMAVPGWRPEGTITLTVQANKTTTATGFYLEQAQARVLPGVMMLLLDDE